MSETHDVIPNAADSPAATASDAATPAAAPARASRRAATAEAEMLEAPTLEHPKSFMGSINPLARLIALLIFSTALLLSVDWVSALTAIVIEIIVFVACGVSLRRLLRYTWYLALIAPLTAVSLILYGAPGGRTYWKWGLIEISDNSLLLGLGIALRVIAMALPALAVFMDTDPVRAADALAQNGRMPVRLVVAALTASRMVGRLMLDWQVLRQARRARGLDDGSWFARMRQLTFTLLVMALRRGSDLATAMEARGFGAATQRTWARPSYWRRRDTVTILLAILAAAATIAFAISVGAFRLFGLEPTT